MLGAFRILASQQPLPRKRHDPHGTHQALPAEIFFSASFSLPKKKFPFPASSSTASSKPAKLPAPAFHHRPPTPQVRFCRLRLTGPTLETMATCAPPTAPSVATSLNPRRARRQVKMGLRLEIRGERKGPKSERDVVANIRDALQEIAADTWVFLGL
jgi:hypothetical protein